MNIQDIISTIINYIKNMNKKDLVIFILIALLFYRTRNVEGTENVAIDDSTLNSSHLAAIRNLGNLAKTLRDGNNIVLPADVKINGKLTVGVNDSVVISNTDKRGDITFKSKNGGTTLIRGYNIGNGIAVHGTDSNFAFQGQCTVDKNLTVKDNLTVEDNLTVNKNATFNTIKVNGSSNFDGTIYANREDSGSKSILAKGTAQFDMIKATGSSNFDGTIYANRENATAIQSKGYVTSYGGFGARGSYKAGNNVIGPYAEYSNGSWDDY